MGGRISEVHRGFNGKSIKQNQIYLVDILPTSYIGDDLAFF